MTAATRTLAERLQEIEDLETQLLTDCQARMVAGDYWKSDWVVLGSIKRSLGLAAGFRKMIEEQNFTVAAPLVRLQLDCGLRLSAMTAVSDPEAYAEAFVNGDKMDKFKSAGGAKLTDRFLVNRMKGDLPWVEQVYDDTCEFVHLSNRFLRNSIAKTDEVTRIVWFQISANDPARRGDEKYFEAIEAFKMAFVLTKAITISYLDDRKTKLADRKPTGTTTGALHYGKKGQKIRKKKS